MVFPLKWNVSRQLSLRSRQLRYSQSRGDAVGSTIRYKWKVAGSIPDGVIEIFH
jgi:hypothetical protein